MLFYWNIEDYVNFTCASLFLWLFISLIIINNFYVFSCANSFVVVVILLLVKYFRSSPDDSLPDMTLTELAKHDGSGNTSLVEVVSLVLMSHHQNFTK